MVRIRSANAKDVDQCAALDLSYETDYVWQMRERLSPDRSSVSFRLVRLPRPMRVEYAKSPDHLGTELKAGGCFLVVEEAREILGYLSASVHHWQQIGWVNSLIINRRSRRQGLGTLLMKRGVAWGTSLGLNALVFDVQTKNHPAIRLGQKLGFKFCGFNDRYYANRDIALFFALNLTQLNLAQQKMPLERKG